MHGAMIERGRVIEVGVDGYTVMSVDRAGITTPPIEAIGSETYAVGDWVFFFLMDDGTGKIVCEL